MDVPGKALMRAEESEQGMYGYQGGDYWNEVVQITGLRRASTSQVGQTFEEILEDLDLPLFYDMRAEGAWKLL